MSMQRYFGLTILSLSLLALSGHLFAAPVGTAFTYQGQLLDDNIAAEGFYDMQFQLFSEPNSAPQTRIGSTVNIEDMDVLDGYFITELNFGKDAFSNKARWLQIAVRPGNSSDPNDYVTLSPRQKITATPNAISSYEVTGRVQTAGVHETTFFNGETWTPVESERQWRSIAMSNDGIIQTVVVDEGYIYISIDSGQTWSPRESSRAWRSVAMSNDGTIQTAVVEDGQIFVSTDTGTTWTPKESNRNWTSVAISANGIIQTAVDRVDHLEGGLPGGSIYVSTDTGNTWIPKDPNQCWQAVAMSDDGTVQTAVVYNGQIYVSSDTGNTWIPKGSHGYWTDVAMSADGSIQIAAEAGFGLMMNGEIHISTDTGNTWTTSGPSANWRSVAISDDGTMQTAVSSNSKINPGYIYFSSDASVTWTTFELDQPLQSVAMSTDGNTQSIVTSSGQIYLSESITAVGIGTTNPAAELHVNGTVKATVFKGDGSGLTNLPTVEIEETDPTVEESVKDGISWDELSAIPAGFADAVDNIGISEETDPQVGTIDSNKIPRWDGSALVTGTIYDNGNVGIGTTTPSANLDIYNPSGQASLLLHGAAASLTVQGDNWNGTTRAEVIIDRTVDYRGGGVRITASQESVNQWYAGVPYTGGGYQIGYHTSQPEYKANSALYINTSGSVGIGTVAPQGTLDVNGTIYQRGGVLHADYVFEPDYSLESIEAHAEYMYAHKHLPAIPARQVDVSGQEVIEVGAHRKGIVEELEKAHIYINQLHKENKKMKKQISEIQKQLDQLLIEQSGGTK